MSKKTSGVLPAKPVAVRYVGRAFLPFVPARDMSASEAAPHWKTLLEAEANGQRLYVPAQDEPEGDA